MFDDVASIFIVLGRDKILGSGPKQMQFLRPRPRRCRRPFIGHACLFEILRIARNSGLGLGHAGDHEHAAFVAGNAAVNLGKPAGVVHGAGFFRLLAGNLQRSRNSCRRNELPAIVLYFLHFAQNFFVDVQGSAEVPGLGVQFREVQFRGQGFFAALGPLFLPNALGFCSILSGSGSRRLGSKARGSNR